MTQPHDTASDQETPELVATVVTAHPAVAGLHGGEFGVIASYLPGRHVAGVRATAPGEPVEVGVVLRFGHPLPEVVAELRTRVETVVGKVPVHITVCDIEAASDDGS